MFIQLVDYVNQTTIQELQFITAAFRRGLFCMQNYVHVSLFVISDK